MSCVASSRIPPSHRIEPNWRKYPTSRNIDTSPRIRICGSTFESVCRVEGTVIIPPADSRTRTRRRTPETAAGVARHQRRVLALRRLEQLALRHKQELCLPVDESLDQ